MHQKSRWISIIGSTVGVALLVGACSSSASTPTANTSLTVGVTNDPTLGAYLTGPNGMTLYVSTSDTPDTSTCTDTCVTTWPPLTVAAGTTITGPSDATGAFATITRSDGTIQVTYNHMPLYYYSAETGPGYTAGQGQSGTWFVAPLSGVVESASPSISPVASPSISPVASPSPIASPSAS